MTGVLPACLKVWTAYTVYTPHHQPLHNVCLNNYAMFWLLDGTIDSQHRDGEDGIDVSTAAPLANNVVLHYFLSDLTAQPH